MSEPSSRCDVCLRPMHEHGANLEHPPAFFAGVAYERERCAKILSDYADARAYDPEEHTDLLEVVARIRSGE